MRRSKTPRRRAQSAQDALRQPQDSSQAPQDTSETRFWWVLRGEVGTIWYQHWILKQLSLKIACRLKTLIFVVPEGLSTCSNKTKIPFKTNQIRVQDGTQTECLSLVPKSGCGRSKRRAKTPLDGRRCPITLPKTFPRRRSNRSKTPPRRPKPRPRRSQDAPRRPQDVPRRPHATPRGLQGPPSPLQTSILEEFGNDFR